MVTYFRGAVLSAAVVLAALPVVAAESTKPDYSKERLILIFRDEPKAASPISIEPYEIRYTRGSWIFRFLPLVAPIVVNDGAMGPTPFPLVDPFFLTGTEFPYTRDHVPVENLAARWSPEEKRYRRKLLGFVRAANARENER